MNKTLVVSYPFGVHSIYAATLGKMFAEFKNQVDTNEYIDINLKRELVVIFQTTFQAATVADGSKNREDGQDPIEALVELASASQIDSHFKTLFEKTGYCVQFDIAPLYTMSDRETRMMNKILEWQN